MSIPQLGMPLSDLRTACQTIVTRLVDDVRRGHRIEVSDLMTRNQLPGLLLAAGTEGEPIATQAQNALDAQYRRLKGSAGHPGD